MSSPRWWDGPAYEAHPSTPGEVDGLLVQAGRCLADAQCLSISPETRHGAAHGAVVFLAKAALSAAGLRTTKSHHYWLIESLAHTVELSEREVLVLQQHRRKRNQSSYEYDGVVTSGEADELVVAVSGLASLVRARLGPQPTDEGR